jgi:hypothetical protein
VDQQDASEGRNEDKRISYEMDKKNKKYKEKN